MQGKHPPLASGPRDRLGRADVCGCPDPVWSRVLLACAITALVFVSSVLGGYRLWMRGRPQRQLDSIVAEALHGMPKEQLLADLDDVVRSIRLGVGLGITDRGWLNAQWRPLHCDAFTVDVDGSRFAPGGSIATTVTCERPGGPTLRSSTSRKVPEAKRRTVEKAGTVIR